MDIKATTTLRDAVIALLPAGQAKRFEEVYPAMDEPPYQAIRRMNGFWRDELALMSQNTASIRGSLVDDSTTSSWLVVFKRDVLPTVLDHHLPR